ncbi:MAG: hypothetical protein IJ695_06820 [Butyrivibrio sp.]|nr:hypothetical protein [Butyrivibrio sp.]
MAIYNITGEAASQLGSHCPDNVISNAGRPGYFTLVSSDDEGFLTGVLQFYIGHSLVRSEIAAVITHIFVQDVFRNHIIGSNLIDELVDIAQKSEIYRVEIDLLPEIPEQNALKSFFSKERFAFYDGYRLYMGALNRFTHSSVFSDVKDTDIHTIDSLSDRDFELMLDALMPNLSPTVRNIDLYEKNVSTYFTTGGSCGMLLVRKVSDFTLEPVFYAATETADNQMRLDLILVCAQKMRENYPGNTVIRIVTDDSRNKKIIKKLCPEIVPYELERGYYTITTTSD